MTGDPGLPDSEFWRFSVLFYASPGIAEACLTLQDREGADVNLILLALWLGARGHRLTNEQGRGLQKLAHDWQHPIVAPLRQVRRQLKQHGHLPWPQPIAHWRQRLGEVELTMERIEQLMLEQAVGQIAQGNPDPMTMRANLTALGLGRVLETIEASELVRLAAADRNDP